MLQFNRFYLLIALPLSFIIPLLTIELSEKTPIAQNISSLEEFVSISPPTEVVSLNETQPVKTERSYLPTILLYGYLLICFLLLLRYLNNLFKIVKTIRLNSIKRIEDASLIVTEESIIPHTFLHYIFVSTHDADNQQILTHELTHARQKHSLDILFIELLQCVLWLNPFITLYKKAIRLNHEFIADEVVINSDAKTATYLQLLLTKASVHSPHSLTSNFSYSLTKKRFIMMTTTKNKTRSTIKIIFSVTIILSTAMLFSEKVYSQQNDTITQVINQIKDNRDSLIVVEFDKIIYKVISYKKDKTGKENFYFNLTGITDVQRNRVLEIYNTMTDEQKSKYSEHIKMGIKMAFTPMPPAKKQSPTAEQMTDFADPAIYGIWLDGKRVPNTELAKYKPSDIAIVWTSRLMKNAAHYSQYKFHTEVMTHTYFDKTYPAKSN